MNFVSNNDSSLLGIEQSSKINTESYLDLI